MRAACCVLLQVNVALYNNRAHVNSLLGEIWAQVAADTHYSSLAAAAAAAKLWWQQG
jgi:hypothetical protein